MVGGRNRIVFSLFIILVEIVSSYPEVRRISFFLASLAESDIVYSP
jgi:hypothetical protein